MNHAESPTAPGHAEDSGSDGHEAPNESWTRQRTLDLPQDLPRSLNDRGRATSGKYATETEMYDGWQGEYEG